MPDINQVQLPDGSQYNIKDDVSGYATETYVQNQIGAITKATIGLGNVNNTSDADKPVSTAQQTALNAKTDNSTIAYVESSTTATKRYEIGDQFILNGVLYKATSIIANAGTIEVGTNCTASDPVATQIDTVKGAVNAKADKTNLTSISETGSTASQAISAGTYFYLDGTLVRAKTAIANGATFTLNTNYEVVTDGALNKSVIYSTEEHIIGKWIDGRDLYQKTLDLGTMPNNAAKNVAHGISNLDFIIDYRGFVKHSTVARNGLPLPFVNSGGTNATSNIRLGLNGSDLVVMVPSDFSSYEGYATIQYVKTS